MIITDKFIFLELQKTGTTTIKKMLVSTLNSQDYQSTEAKHGGIRSYVKLHGEIDRPVLMGIRNPFSWYVSLFSFGTKFGGMSMYNKLNLTKTELDKLNELYSDPNNIENFREWFYLTQELRARSKNQVIENYNIGFYTMRYLSMCLNRDGINKLRGAKLPLKDIYRDYNQVNHFIKMENLTEDVMKALKNIGALDPLYEAEMKERLSKKKNVSKHKKYTEYYTEELKSFINESDDLIFSNHDYDKW